MAVAGPGTAVETEVQSISLTDGVRGKVAGMGGLLYSTNWKFCTYTFLNKYQTYFLSVFSLVELRAIYKLGSGKANNKGL